MAILDIIEFFDESGDIMIARVPPEGSGEFRLGSQLIVQENQQAVFFRGGQAYDSFRAGRHTLAAQNLPLLQKLISLPFGGRSPFKAYVYFVAMKTFPNLGWGTAAPVTFPCKVLRMVTLRAYGAYSIRIRDPRIFMNTLVGTKGLETTFDIEEFFRSIIVARLNTALGEKMESILELPAQYTNIGLMVKEAVKDDFGQYGIELVDLLVEAITVPPEVQEMLNRASGIAAQDVEKYKDIAMADAMREAAQNPGGAGQGAGLGVGLGMGMGMARQVAEQMGGAGAPPAPASPEAPPAAPAETSPPPADPASTEPASKEPASKDPASKDLGAKDLGAKLRQLKELRDEGLITDEDFESQKRRILDQI